jgi:hypothetical protein
VYAEMKMNRLQKGKKKKAFTEGKSEVLWAMVQRKKYGDPLGSSARNRLTGLHHPQNQTLVYGKGRRGRARY